MKYLSNIGVKAKNSYRNLSLVDHNKIVNVLNDYNKIIKNTWKILSNITNVMRYQSSYATSRKPKRNLILPQMLSYAGETSIPKLQQRMFSPEVQRLGNMTERNEIRKLKCQASMIKEGMSNPGQYMTHVNNLDQLDERLHLFH